MIGKLKTLCMVHTEKEFYEKLEDLVKNLNDDAKEWLKVEMEDKDKWAQSFDEGGMRLGYYDHKVLRIPKRYFQRHPK